MQLLWGENYMQRWRLNCHFPHLPTCCLSQLRSREALWSFLYLPSSKYSARAGSYVLQRWERLWQIVNPSWLITFCPQLVWGKQTELAKSICCCGLLTFREKITLQHYPASLEEHALYSDSVFQHSFFIQVPILYYTAGEGLRGGWILKEQHTQR